MNVLTGELTQRIGEVVLDGSENWSINNSNNNGHYSAFCTNYVSVVESNAISNKLPSFNNSSSRGISIGKIHPYIVLSYNIEKDGVNNLTTFKEYLSQNPLTVQYQLGTELIKTDDSNILKKPYEGTNHYELTSNIPCEVVLEVPVVSTGNQTLEEINN